MRSRIRFQSYPRNISEFNYPSASIVFKSTKKDHENQTLNTIPGNLTDHLNWYGIHDCFPTNFSEWIWKPNSSFITPKCTSDVHYFIRAFHFISRTKSPFCFYFGRNSLFMHSFVENHTLVPFYLRAIIFPQFSKSFKSSRTIYSKVLQRSI